jgi:trk system potassium uptake protein
VRLVIVGCGRLGARLAVEANRSGHEVAIVDNDPRSFRRLPADFPAQVVLGTGIDEDVLRSAGIELADAFIAATENDNTNIMAAQIALRVFEVDHVVLRVYDPDRAEIYRDLGLKVVCPTRLVADLMEDEIPGFHGDDFSFVPVTDPR